MRCPKSKILTAAQRTLLPSSATGSGRRFAPRRPVILAQKLSGGHRDPPLRTKFKIGFVGEALRGLPQSKRTKRIQAILLISNYFIPSDFVLQKVSLCRENLLTDGRGNPHLRFGLCRIYVNGYAAGCADGFLLSFSPSEQNQSFCPPPSSEGGFLLGVGGRFTTAIKHSL